MGCNFLCLILNSHEHFFSNHKTAPITFILRETWQFRFFFQIFKIIIVKHLHFLLRLWAFNFRTFHYNYGYRSLQVIQYERNQVAQRKSWIYFYYHACRCFMAVQGNNSESCHFHPYTIVIKLEKESKIQCMLPYIQNPLEICHR